MSHAISHKRRTREIGALLPLGALCGVLTGTFTNAINGWLSPTYFLATIGWKLNSDFQIWARSVAEGALEGCILSAILGLILMIYVGFTSQLCCPLKASASALYETIAITLLFCIVIGFNAVLLALFVPALYEPFFGLPPSKSEILRFAWVAGSINSMGWGGLLAVCIACARFGARWKRRVKAAERDFFAQNP